MRVLLLSHEYPPFLFGGVGIFVKDLAHGLAELGLDVTVISGKPMPWKKGQQPNSDATDDRITTIALPYPNLVPRHITFQLFNQTKLKRIIEEVKPDVIHGQSGSAFPAITGLKKSAPVVVTFHGSPAMVKMLSLNSVNKGGTLGDFFVGVLGYPAYEYGYRAEYKNASANVAVSESLMKQLSAEMNIADDKFQFIRNGVNLRYLDELCSHSCTSSQNSRKPTLVFGGRLFWSKGVLNLVDLAYLLEKKYLLDLEIVIYGSGPMYKIIEQRKIMYGLKNLILREFASRSDFLREVMGAKFVLIPSFYEAAPMVLLESMSMGKIPVMFDMPYSREFTEGGKYGILAENVADMALKIKDMYNSGLASQMESKIRSFALENFSIEKTSRAYYSLYQKVINTFQAH
jgi:glycosyltransferase involved in cell wall biosynthesis